jgi:tRNA 2-thiouridine synthesizing protein E
VLSLACTLENHLNIRKLIMNHPNQNIIRPGYDVTPIPGFPHAPMGWTREDTKELAHKEGLTLTEDHWQVVLALQEICARNERPAMKARELHDALDEHFHSKGGITYLYELLPRGPLAQGCLLAGLQPPAGTQDKGFGSAV